MWNNERFAHPLAEDRIHPFWFWNGEMEEQEIRRQIGEMNDKGVGGFFLCARQGMTVPYLSKDWFVKVRMAVECAEEHGMNVWLYDEYPYPSGIAGGEVLLEHPEAKHMTLEHRVFRAYGGEQVSVELPWGKVLLAKAAPIRGDGTVDWAEAVDLREQIGNLQADPVFQKTGLTAYTQKRFFTYRTVLRLGWEVPAGEWEIAVFQEKEVDEFKYYGTFVDPCNRAAMESFIRLTHDRYVPEVGDFFGKTVKGMFTDEIGLLGRIPWSPRLAEEFKQRTGYDLLERLPALLDGTLPDAAKVRYDYYQTIHLLLREAYHQKVGEWCDEHGLEYVAEVPSVRMTTQKFSHVPGGDSAHEKLGRSLDWCLRRYYASMRANPKMISSLSRQLGRSRNLIECFHSVGWSMTLQDARWMIDRMAALGTNFYNFHAFYYTMDALAKHDAPPSQFLQNPYWAHFRQLGDYTGRISYLMTEGKADIRIAMLDPVTTLWTAMANPFHSFGFAGTDEEEKRRMERLRKDWEDLGVGLLRERIDYDHLDPELLAEAEIAGGQIRLGHAAYSVLILPPLTNVEAAAWARIREFVAAGGTVIAAGLLPHQPIEAGSPGEDEAMRLFGLDRSPRAAYWGGAAGDSAAGRSGTAHFLPVTAEGGWTDSWPALVGLLEAVCPRAVRFETAEDPRCFLMQTRNLADGKAAVFVSNQEGGDHAGALVIDPAQLQAAAQQSGAADSLRFLELDLETGETRPLPAERRGQDWRVPLHLAPYQARAVLVEPAAEAEAAPASPRWGWAAQADAPWTVAPEQGNAVRFADFALRIRTGGPDGAFSQDYPAHAKTFVDQCSDLAGEASFPLRFAQTFGTPMRLALSYPIEAEYRAEFEVEALPAACDLFMDRGAISGVWSLTVNGRELPQDALRPCEIYDHRNVAGSIASLLREGANEICVRVTIEQDWDGVTDPLYLGGSFGVSLSASGRPVLTAAPETAESLKGGPLAGFPYYAGTMIYRRSVELAGLPAEPEFDFRFHGWDPNFHDCAEVLVNGHSLGVRTWSPYQWSGHTKWLREGVNDIEVRVTNTLVGLLDGNTFDYASHTLVPAANPQS